MKFIPSSLFKHMKLLPLLILVAALSFGVRFGEFVTGVSELPGKAVAQQNMLDGNAQKKDMGEINKPSVEMPEPPSVEEPRTAPIKANEPEDVTQNWRDASEESLEFSEMRMELFEDLVARRRALEERERELSVREALLKTAEKEIEQKYNELVSLRSEIQELLKEQSEEEKARIASLVKIYEGMKPKDAARIFNTLDLDVLISVVGRMSERKSAPILASMDPERARTLTIMLMEQKSLPNLSETDMSDSF